jgi:hypothetical protein
VFRSRWLASGAFIAFLAFTGAAGASAVPRAVVSSSAAPAATTELTSSGLMQARFEATLHKVMGQRAACSDAAVKVALRFVICRSPAVRYSGYIDTFRGQQQAPPFSLTRRAPSPGSYGVTAVPVQIGAEYLLCRSNHYVLRIDTISFSLACN